MQRAAGLRFEQHIDERAALEILGAEPAVEHIKDREQLIDRIRRATLNLGLEPIPRPDFFTTIEKRNRQIELRFEVAVKAGLSAARPRKDRIDANLIDALGQPLVGVDGRPSKSIEGLPILSAAEELRMMAAE